MTSAAGRGPEARRARSSGQGFSLLSGHRSSSQGSTHWVTSRARATPAQGGQAQAPQAPVAAEHQAAESGQGGARADGVHPGHPGRGLGFQPGPVQQVHGRVDADPEGDGDGHQGQEGEGLSARARGCPGLPTWLAARGTRASSRKRQLRPNRATTSTTAPKARRMTSCRASLATPLMARNRGRVPTMRAPVSVIACSTRSWEASLRRRGSGEGSLRAGWSLGAPHPEQQVPGRPAVDGHRTCGEAVPGATGPRRLDHSGCPGGPRAASPEPPDRGSPRRRSPAPAGTRSRSPASA